MQRLKLRFLAAVLAAIPMMAVGVGIDAANAAPLPSWNVLSKLAVGEDGGWDYLSFDSRRQHLFVSRGTRVMVFDMSAGKQVGVINDTPGVHGIAIADELGRGYTSNGKGNSVTVFDLASLKTITTIAVNGINPDAIVYDPASRHVFTFNGKSHTASVIDPQTNRVFSDIPLPGKPEFAVSDGKGHVYVNIEDKSELLVIDTRSNAVVKTWSLAPGESPSGLAIDTAHHRLFSVCDNERMMVLNSDNGRVITSVPVGDGPDAVVFDPNVGIAYSSNGDSGTITAVRETDAQHFTVAETIPTQASARTLALDPQRHHLYLSAATPSGTKTPEGKPTMVPGSFVLLTVGQP